MAPDGTTFFGPLRSKLQPLGCMTKGGWSRRLRRVGMLRLVALSLHAAHNDMHVSRSCVSAGMSLMCVRCQSSLTRHVSFPPRLHQLHPAVHNDMHVLKGLGQLQMSLIFVQFQSSLTRHVLLPPTPRLHQLHHAWDLRPRPPCLRHPTRRPGRGLQ